MKKITFLLVGFMLLVSPLMRADEGMWFLAFIGKNYAQMKALGFKLTPEDIYSINHSSLKDAVVALDHGSCTAEIVSSQGLLFTNHHCGYENIQAHSSVEHDYLRDGFWAKSMDEELPNPGKTVSFLIRMSDVTSQVLANVPDNLSEKMRESVIRKNIKAIEKKAVAGTIYEAQVKSMYEGNAYYLFIYEVYKDVRLVGAPPSSIGKFGGDTDNWMWPRQTGDFSIFRVYTAPDGSPAEYSPNNIPLKPKRYLKISLKGEKAGDFAMIMGYPGSTNRYLTADGVKEVMHHENDIRIKVRTEKLNILKKYMNESPEIKLQYSAKYAQSANYWKYSIGQNLGLRRLKVIKRKRKLQRELMKWVKADPKRLAKYGDMFKDIDEAIKKHSNADIAQNYWFEAVYLGPELLQFALKNYGLYRALQGNDQNLIDSMTTVSRKNAEEFFKDYNSKVDKDLFVHLVKMFFDNVKKEYYPSVYKVIKDNYGGDINKYADAIYSSSILTNKEKFMDMLKKPSFNVFAEDLGFTYATSMLQGYWTIKGDKDKIDVNYQKGRRLFLKSYMQMLKDKNPKALFYPDANSTMRLTYGTVGGYTYGKKTYKYYSTIDEYMAKENPNDSEFVVSKRMKELYKKKDWGQYADKNGVLRIDFLTNNDITGGNSGSPVLNGEGQLIGLAFDGNWEGMSGDIAFEPKLQKTICVDIRFVLWVIDKYANDQRLIKELDIVK